MTFDEACEIIFTSEKANEYAKAYARAGFGMPSRSAAKVQALYILNNITHWREPIAKEVRAFLKEFAK